MPAKRYDPRGVGYMSTGEYERGYDDGFQDGRSYNERMQEGRERVLTRRRRRPQKPKKKRTLSKWQKFMKSPKSQIKIKRGKDKGKLNLKAMGRAYRKEQKGKK